MPYLPFHEAALHHSMSRDDDSLAHLLSFAAFDVPSGHVLNWRTDHEWFSEGVRLSRPALPPGRSIALLDNTTLTNALTLLSPDHGVTGLPAGAILDLGTFATAFVFEDHLVALNPGPVVDAVATKLLPGDSQLVQLAWQSNETFGKVLTHLWDASERFTSGLCQAPAWQTVLQRHWTYILGADIPEDFYLKQGDYRKYFSSVCSMAMEHAIVETDRYHDWSALSHGEWLGLRDSFAAESTLRAVFCQFYASAIGATYYANAYRAQIRSLVSSEVTHTDPRTSLALLEYL